LKTRIRKKKAGIRCAEDGAQWLEFGRHGLGRAAEMRYVGARIEVERHFIIIIIIVGQGREYIVSEEAAAGVRWKGIFIVERQTFVDFRKSVECMD
jgi:hypothetical protein